MSSYSRLNVPSTTPIDYILHRPNEEAEDVYILLHGHAQTGQFIFDKLKHLIPEGSIILSPNAPFPLPSFSKVNNELKLGYTWYFYNSKTNEFLIDFNYSSKIILNLINLLALGNKRLHIIGYSQGGYLSPFVAQELKNVVRVIGIACNFRSKFLSKNPICPLHAIHGTGDLVVDYSGALDSFEDLKKMGNQGTFITIEDEGHRLSQQYYDEIRKILA